MCEAFPLLWCAHGARTAKLLCTGQSPSQWGTFSGGGHAPAPPQMAKQSLRHRLSAEQSCSARPVRAPKEEHWPCHWQSAAHKRRATALACERPVPGTALSLSPVRAPKEGHWHCHWQGAAHKPFGLAKGLAKGFILRLKLFSKTFPYPLALPSRFCYTCNRQQWAGPSEEARATPIPLRIERKKE